ncbi:type I restriction endonuclease subunit R [Agrococcus beijingensis]|uniref:type I restriction endonuclease subunit R n=1 Tax=Agrococcus beijingensis TaxID=3068634 RepID=UPI0027418EAA|nr:HsdR family type I site-specific deoxyribonuclease [Agrococcus sp. REN33]
MTGLGEHLSVRQPLVAALVAVGWKHVPAHRLERELESPLIERELTSALERLNPLVAEAPERAEEVLRPLRAALLSAREAGLVVANRDMAEWLRGSQSVRFLGAPHDAPVRLIDFEDPAANSLIVSEEVSFGVPGHTARFDLVLWVNGLPLAVLELKSPVKHQITWANGATELVRDYQPGWPEFFVPNVLVAACDGRELHYAGVGAPVEAWSPWGDFDEPYPLQRVLDAASDLLSPARVLSFLRDFTLFETPEDNASAELVKLVARYTQVQSVELITARALDPERNRGLIYHTQGSGKTLAMVFAAARLLREPAMQNPTIVLVADRLQLVRQLWDQFRTASMPRLVVPQSAAALRSALGQQDRRGMIFATVQKFAGAGVLNQRSNIVLMADEAHRTQEGDLGTTMRASLPNASMFGFTGTPIAELDRSTFRTFGDESDEGRVLHSYDAGQSIRDGMTVPLHVSPRKVEFRLDKEALDEAFDALRTAEGLDEADADVLARRASRVSTFFGNPDRVRQVCADVVDHFYSHVDPSGMKAQVVVYDRAACVAYTEELRRLLEERGTGDEVEVVMTVEEAKGDDGTWAKYKLTEQEEERVLSRFRTYGDPLKFLVCTSKLGTGFNAPIEGVMYLDKPLKRHTLFQTITRANRTWRNPETGKDKRYGTIVDYVGLGDEFAEAMKPAQAGQDGPDIDEDALLQTFEQQLHVAMLRFAGLDYAHPTAHTLIDAQQRMPKPADRDEFAAAYLMLEGIWETLAPDARLYPHKPAYRFIAQLYRNMTPSDTGDNLLWQRLGAKTLELVYEHMRDVRVTSEADVVIADVDTIRDLIESGPADLEGVEDRTVDEIIDSIAARLKKRLQGANGDHPVYRSLAERLDQLRARALEAAQASIDWLRAAFELAKDVTEAERAEDEAGAAGLSLLPDPRIGALTAIFREAAPQQAPDMIERVVLDIDDIVRQTRFTGWVETRKGDQQVRAAIREVLKRHLLLGEPGLFERAYGYVAANY